MWIKFQRDPEARAPRRALTAATLRALLAAAAGLALTALVVHRRRAKAGAGEAVAEAPEPSRAPPTEAPAESAGEMAGAVAGGLLPLARKAPKRPAAKPKPSDSAPSTAVPAPLPAEGNDARLAELQQRFEARGAADLAKRDFASAERALSKALQIAEGRLGEDSLELCLLLGRIADTHYHQRKVRGGTAQRSTAPPSGFGQERAQAKPRLAPRRGGGGVRGGVCVCNRARRAGERAGKPPCGAHRPARTARLRRFLSGCASRAESRD